LGKRFGKWILTKLERNKKKGKEVVRVLCAYVQNAYVRFLILKERL
jgi:hypothetical protein